MPSQPPRVPSLPCFTKLSSTLKSSRKGPCPGPLAPLAPGPSWANAAPSSAALRVLPYPAPTSSPARPVPGPLRVLHTTGAWQALPPTRVGEGIVSTTQHPGPTLIRTNTWVAGAVLIPIL